MGNCYSIYSYETSILKNNKYYLLYFNRNKTFYNNLHYMVTINKPKYTIIKKIKRYHYS